MFTLTDEQIEKAINWWADQICSPKFDAGADSNVMKLAENMATALVQSVNIVNKEKFKEELRNTLLDKFNPLLGLHVDYHPDKALYDSAKASEISEHNFPWKTSMYFDPDGSVKVKCGYGSKIQEI